MKLIASNPSTHFFTRVCSPGKTSFSTPETPSPSLELVSFQSHGRQLPILHPTEQMKYKTPLKLVDQFLMLLSYLIIGS
jgi:hypothetical protein